MSAKMVFMLLLSSLAVLSGLAAGLSCSADNQINGTQVSIDGYGMVIDAEGNWVGQPITGVQGPQGPQGETGPVGPEGAQGPPGPEPDLSAIEANIASLQSEMTAMEYALGSGNITRMSVLSGGKTLAGGESWVITENYTEVRHVSLTIAYGPVETGDSVNLYYGVGETYMGEVLPSGAGDRITLEFNTDRWQLAAYESGGTTSLHLSYAATVTYRM